MTGADDAPKDCNISAQDSVLYEEEFLRGSVYARSKIAGSHQLLMVGSSPKLQHIECNIISAVLLNLLRRELVRPEVRKC